MKVRGLGDESFFEEISVKKAANFHSVCTFKQRVADEKILIYQNAVGKKIEIELNEGRPIFFGEIVEVTVEQLYSGIHAEVKAISDSAKIDEKLETRIFQNPDKKFSDVLNTSRLNISNCTINLDEKISAQKCPEIILQHDETNFKFINRLAAWKCQRVWVKDTIQGKCELKVAACADDSPNKISQENILKLKIGRREKIRIAELVTAKYFELGRILNFDDDTCKYLIVALEVYQENGVDRIKYTLEELKDLEPTELCNVAPVKLTAKVLDVKDDKNFGRLKVQFDIEDKDANKNWLPYRTPYSGIVFMPEKGDTVEIFYTQGECYVNSILRTKILDDEFRKDVENEKYLGNNRKQRIFFREKSFEIKSFDTSIFMDEKKIILSVGKNKVTLDENGITVQTGGEFKSEVAKDFALKVSGDMKSDVAKKISVKAGGEIVNDAGSNVSVKAGGKFTAKASSTAQIGGSTVELG